MAVIARQTYSNLEAMASNLHFASRPVELLDAGTGARSVESFCNECLPHYYPAQAERNGRHSLAVLVSCTQDLKIKGSF